MIELLNSRRPQVAELCRLFHVRRLEVFGSAARGEDFDPEHSDVDFLVEFAPDSTEDYADAYFGLTAGLEALLGHRVDLVNPTAVRNPYVRAAINKCREPVYEA